MSGSSIARRTSRLAEDRSIVEAYAAPPESLVRKIGVEIEGFWTAPDTLREEARVLTGCEGASDGSLPDHALCESDDDGDASSCGSCSTCSAESWEVRVGGNVGAPVSDALSQAHALYPDYTSADCGMHVHMSFADKSAATWLACDDFFAFYRERWESWGREYAAKSASEDGAEFWRRLTGENQFCRPCTERGLGYSGARVSRDLHDLSSRYWQVNFSAWGRHRTVEFRTLPQFASRRRALLAIRHSVEIVEAWLAGARVVTLAVPGVIDLATVGAGLSESVGLSPIASVAPISESVGLSPIASVAPSVPGARLVARLPLQRIVGQVYSTAGSVGTYQTWLRNQEGR